MTTMIINDEEIRLLSETMAAYDAMILKGETNHTESEAKRTRSALAMFSRRIVQ